MTLVAVNNVDNAREHTTRSPRIQGFSESLRKGASERILDYSQRFEKSKGLYEKAVKNLVVSNWSLSEAYDTASQLFGDEIRFAGIDGTMYSSPLLDLVIFFGGAYASCGRIVFPSDSLPQVQYDEGLIEEGLGVSAVVPIFINEIPEIDQTYLNFDPEGSPISQTLDDQWHIDNSLIANSMMTFSEYFLAHRLVTDPDKDIRFILLDRSLSGERASLLYDTSKPAVWKEASSLIGFEVSGVKIDERDLAFGRHHLCSAVLGLPPPRGDYLRYAVLSLLESGEHLSADDICKRLGIVQLDRKERVEKVLKSPSLRGYMEKRGSVYALKERYQRSWHRLTSAVETIGRKLFSPPGDREDHVSLRIQSRGTERWLTTLDLSFLTLFCLQMLVEECWKRRAFLVGLTKDTSARDFKRQLLPIMSGQGLLKGELSRHDLEVLPNTDRMILQALSMGNTDQMKVPWALVEYDSCFKTLMPHRRHGPGFVLGARKNKTSLEKAFLKSYVQLSEADSDPRLRSNVLLVDRMTCLELDVRPETLYKCRNLYDGADEPIELLLFGDKTVGNPAQNLIMSVLCSMLAPSIPEVFGHNRPLFVADKVAKWHYDNMKRIVDGTRTWIVNDPRLREFVFYMGSFRERRSSFEAARRR